MLTGRMRIVGVIVSVLVLQACEGAAERTIDDLLLSDDAGSHLEEPKDTEQRSGN